MKIVALLSGLLASAFAWAAGVYVTDIGAQFLALWPDTVSQQFLGLVVWHALVAGALVGGVLAVFSPPSGAILLAAMAGGWAALAAILPIGFGPQMIVPIALSGLGALAAIGAMVRGHARRQAEQRPTQEEIEREEALRLEPSEPPLPDFDLGQSLKLEPETPVTGIVPPAAPPRRRDDGPPHGLSGLMAANVAALILLAGAVGILIYSELRSGDLVAAFAPSGPQAARVAEGMPRIAGEQAAPGARESDAAAVVDPEEAVDTATSDAATAAPQVVPVDASGMARLPDIEAPAAQDGALLAGPIVETAALGDEPYLDPFSYCAAVGTVDFPDHRYAGPYLVPVVADALRVPAASSPDRVKWRCFEGAVLGCASFDWPICAVTPSVPEMLEFCSKNPNARGLQAPNGNWSCNGTRPEIPAGENWPVDARGFLPTAWITIPPTAAAG